jgi:hypothetical protein
MAKLPKATAKAAAEAESGSFEALPAGPYIGKLTAVVTDKEGPSGPYWVWEFEVVSPDEFANRKLWANTSLSDKAVWKLKEMFDAFGYTTDSDTDELIGEQVKLMVSQRVIASGTRSGEMGNNVDRVLSYDADEPAGESSDGGF